MQKRLPSTPRVETRVALRALEIAGLKAGAAIRAVHGANDFVNDSPLHVLLARRLIYSFHAKTIA
jgi:CelD/BcsL family acetyltransferase involved in cellulose biosynthesis